MESTTQQPALQPTLKRRIWTTIVLNILIYILYSIFFSIVVPLHPTLAGSSGWVISLGFLTFYIHLLVLFVLGLIKYIFKNYEMSGIYFLTAVVLWISSAFITTILFSILALILAGFHHAGL